MSKSFEGLMILPYF